jgi:hypothetical protein
LLPALSFQGHQCIPMLPVPGPGPGQSLFDQGLIDTSASLSVDIGQDPVEFVHFTRTQVYPYAVSSQLLETVSGLPKALLALLRSIHPLETDPALGAVQGVAINYPVYRDQRAVSTGDAGRISGIRGGRT